MESILNGAVNVLENLEIGLDLLKKYGPFTKCWLGPQIIFGLQDVNDVEVNNYNTVDKTHLLVCQICIQH